MKRLLCIVGSMNAGGAETFLMKIYRQLDKDKYQMDFCVAEQSKNFYEDEIKLLGGKMYRITPKSKNPIKNFNDIRQIVKENNYLYVIRISQNSLSSLELLAAKIGGAKKLIFRSSNTDVYGKKIEKIIHYLFRPLANSISNVKIAPSKDAGKFMFGRNKFTIINNGLNISDYAFSLSDRKKYRKQFGIDDDNRIIIGHVGRFNVQKNHKFLVEIFFEYHKHNENSELWLFGMGEKEKEIKKMVKEFNIQDSVKFMGVKKEINKIYSAMDCFIFPSLFEGMPNTVIEAQTSGLPCLVSKNITSDCNITGDVCFLPLSDNINLWIDSIHFNNEKRREKQFNYIKKANYDIEDVVKIFVEKVYR